MAYNNYSIDDIAARKSYVSYNGKSLGDITIAVSGIPRPVDLTQAIVFDSSLHISDMGQNLSYYFIGTSSIDTSSVDIYTTYVPQPIALAYTTSIYRYDSSYGQFENMSQLYGIFLPSSDNIHLTTYVAFNGFPKTPSQYITIVFSLSNVFVKSENISLIESTSLNILTFILCDFSTDAK